MELLENLVINQAEAAGRFVCCGLILGHTPKGHVLPPRRFALFVFPGLRSRCLAKQLLTLLACHDEAARPPDPQAEAVHAAYCDPWNALFWEISSALHGA